jgi:uncharacterized protein (DUF2336 family)
MAQALSQYDIDRLLTAPSAAARIEVARKLGQDLDSPLLTASHLRAAQDIVRIMAKDVEVTVRAALADSLRATKCLPRDVALAMANDVDAVALPILGHSLVLTNEDLLQLVRRASMTRQTAIAGRPDVSEALAMELIRRGEAITVSTLLANGRARVGEDGLSLAIARFADSEIVTDAMARRASLPVGIAERLVAIVSDELRDYLVAHHRLPPALAMELALRSRERATLDLNNRFGAEQVEALVAQMHANGRLTPTLVLRALCIGDMAFFEAAIAAMAAVPISNTRVLIHDAGENGFAALYRKSGLPTNLFAIFRAATEVIDTTHYDGAPHDMERFRSRVIARILTMVDCVPQSDVDYLLDRLRDVVAA